MIAPMADATVEAGHEWDAVRVPEDWAQRVLGLITADREAWQRLGPVVLSTVSGCTYWLVPTGTAAADWPDGCRLLSRGDSLVLPCDGVSLRSAHWLYRPRDHTQLTGATWLADALGFTRRAA
jgi:hypothetical protein